MCIIFVQVVVTIADLADSEYTKTKSNLIIKTDAKLKDVKKIKYDAVVIPGGPSHKTLASVSLVFYYLIIIILYKYFLKKISNVFIFVIILLQRDRPPQKK